MSELISKPQALLHRTPIEAIQINAGQEVEPPKNRKWHKRAILATLGYLAFVVADNVIYYYDEMSVMASAGAMVEDVDGCDPFPKIGDSHRDVTVLPMEITTEEIKATKAVDEELADTKSAANNFKPQKLNPIKFIADWVNIHRHEILNFESEYSGMDIHLYSDTPDNPFEMSDKEDTIQIVDSLIHSSLSEDIEYNHITASAFVDCLRERFIAEDGPRELEDERMNVYIPSRPGVCFSDGLVQDFPEGAEYNSFCDSLGGTYKDIRLAIRPFYEYKRDWSVLMSHKKTPEEVNRKISKMLIHEPTHLFMQYAGLPFDYDPNEKLADYLEKETIEQLYYDELPTSIKYLPSAYDELD